VTRARFGLLLALLALVVAGATFAVGLAVLDDDEPDPPPTVADTGDTLAPDPATASTTSAPAAPATGEWIVVIASEESEDEAGAIAADVVAAGHPGDVLRSDDYPSLNAGFWVAFAGPYPDRGAAEAAVVDLEGDGFTGTYARCAGTEEACGG
jgi:cell division septation protein DedD